MATTRQLDITLISAKDLKDVNLLSKMDLYAVATLSGYPRTRQRTPTDQDCGKNPKWNCPVRFNIPEGVDLDKLVVDILIRCEKALGDRDVGEVHIPLKEFESGMKIAGESKFISYQVRTMSGKAQGVLNLSYKFGDPISAAPGMTQTAGYTPVESKIGDQQPAWTPPAGYPPTAGGQQPPMAPPAGYPPTESKIGGPSPPAGYPPTEPKFGEPVTAYPGYGVPPAAGPSSAYSAPPPPAGYPPYGAPPPAGYPGAPLPQGYGSQPPPPAYGYGSQPPPPGPYGYPGYGAPPPAGYPGYGAPPPTGYSGYAPPPVQQPPKKNKFGLGLGAGLLGGAIGGLLIGDAIGDIADYDAGYDGGFDDAGGGFDF